MKINNRWLNKWEACSEGVEWFNEHKFKTDIECLKALMKEDLEWTNWTITKLFNRKQRIRYAVYAAKQVLHIFEKEYPEDKRPREAINAAIKCIDNNTKKNRAASDAARAAAWAARAAARAAAMAAMAASDAARAAASEAASGAWWAAAWAARDAARDAARVAVRVAVRAAMKTKILKYGIKLLSMDHGGKR